jgi:hypothetical protein
MSDPDDTTAASPDETGGDVEEKATEPDEAVKDLGAGFLKADEPTGSA